MYHLLVSLNKYIRIMALRAFGMLYLARCFNGCGLVLCKLPLHPPFRLYPWQRIRYDGKGAEELFLFILIDRFGAYDVQMRWFRQIVTHKDGSRKPRLAEGTANFVAGGLGSSKFTFNADLFTRSML